DYELDGVPEAQALGDNNAGVNDEDGVRFKTSLVAGQSATLEVVASTNGFLNAWIDWNGNGNWSDIGDQILTNKALVAGTNTLTFTVFPGATASNTFGRFRFSTQAGLSFTGPAPDGEVEDYAVSVVHAADLAVITTALPDPVAVGSNLTYTVTVQNLGPSLATGVALTNTLPGNVTLVSSTSSQGACSLAGSVVTCGLGSIPASGSASVTMVVRPVLAGSITNLARAGGSELDLNLANNSGQTIGTVENPPIVTAQPVSLVVTQGNAVVFHSAATGTGPLIYQWQLNGTDLPGAISADYSFANAQMNQEGSYTVKVSNRVGTVISSAANLIVRVPPGIAQQPQNQTNYAGGLATLSVSATGTAPIQYQWFFNATNLLAGQTNTLLTLANAQKTNTGNYAVIVANAAGSITSSVARLTILEADFGDASGPGYPTTLANNGARHLLAPGVFLGSRIDFEPDGQPTSSANGDDLNGLNDEDGVLFTGPLHVGQTETIRVVASTNGFLSGWIDFDRNGSWAEAGEKVFVNQPLFAGTNQLSVTTPPGAGAGATFARFRFSTALNIGLGGEAPDGEVEDYQVTVQPSTDLALGVSAPAGVANGSNLALTFAVTNKGPSAASGVVLTQTWSGPATFVSVTSSQGNCNIVGGVLSCDLGSLASGAVATVSLQLQSTAVGTISHAVSVTGTEPDPAGNNNVAQLVVQVQDPPAIVTQPQNLTVTNGNTIALSVAAAGTSLRYQWQFQGNNLAGQTNSTLIIPNAQVNHSGTYRVVVENAVASIPSATAEVVVLAPPNIVIQPLPRTAMIGQSVVFSVTANGTSPLLYEWWLEGSPLPGANGATLTLTNVQPADGGVYAVRISNPAGSVTSTGALLTIIIAPSISQQPADTFIVAGNPAALSVGATGTDPLQYQWFFNRTILLAGKTNSALVFASTSKALNGLYNVVVANAGGAVTSAVARLTVQEMDFGDAPEASLLAFNGARHVIVPGVYLGKSVDFEPDGQPGADALGDDLNGINDDDGVFFVSPLLVGQMAMLDVVASTNGFLDTWVDFNNNGTWADGSEQVFTKALLQAGTNHLSFSVPDSAVPGAVFARFRFSTQGGLDYFGPAQDGEVEDYLVSISPAADLGVQIEGQPSVSSLASNLNYVIKVRNSGPSVATGVVITNILPAGASVVSLSTDHGTCAQTNGMIFCDAGQLERGAEMMVQVGLVPQSAGHLTNRVFVSATEADGNAADNSAIMSTV
ncbi:MAG: C-terminal target protein, partial [Verrucomicrobiales bacterium]|nr:C-terminal target protein [Verrucomicrobiales bacterium]